MARRPEQANAVGSDPICEEMRVEASKGNEQGVQGANGGSKDHLDEEGEEWHEEKASQERVGPSAVMVKVFQPQQTDDDGVYIGEIGHKSAENEIHVLVGKGDTCRPQEGNFLGGGNRPLKMGIESASMDFGSYRQGRELIKGASYFQEFRNRSAFRGLRSIQGHICLVREKRVSTLNRRLQAT